MSALNATTAGPDLAPSPIVVVTGAAGWLGQNLVRALAGPRTRVRCLVHDADDAPLLENIAPTVETVVGDVRDPAAVDRLFETVSAATVFHAAGSSTPSARSASCST